ncbi:MAG: PTS glucose transporter subunit IIA [Holdemanella sp.]|nr:PTS glucose transporter subunit IIA [Holdemanella sp.]
MAKNYAELAKTILELVGGESNVTHLEHCSTRLRFSIADSSKVQVNELKSTKGVMGVISSGNQCQVVIGNDVVEAYDELKKLGNFSGGAVADEPKQKGNIAATALDLMVGIFQPLVPAIAGGGILKAFLSLFALLGWMDSAGTLYRVLMLVGDAPLYFLPAMVAVTMATKLNCNKLVALATVGALLLPKTSELIAEGTTLFGFPIQNVTYAYQVFPAVLVVSTLYFIEKYVTKICPKPIRVFFVPLVCFTILFPLTLLFLGPVGLTIGKAITTVMLAIYSKVGWLAVGLVAMVLPLLISIGAHKAFIPYVISSLGELGYEILYNAASLAHNISEGGASLAVAVKTKDPELKSAAISGGISAIFGITEPAIYSVTLQHKRVLYGVMIGSFISGSFLGLMAVKAFVAMGPGLAGMAMFVDANNPKNIMYAFAGFGIALCASFIATFILYKDECPNDSKEVKAESLENEIVSPMDGQLIDISEVPDQVFASKMIGDGMAIIPTNNEVYAPCDGVVDSIFATNHALILTCDNGAEILIHVGLNTVQLDGKYFDVKVKKEDKVKKGQVLLTFEKEKIEEAGYKLVTPIVVCNADDLKFTKSGSGETKVGKILMAIE